MSIAHGSRRLLRNLYSIFSSCGIPNEFILLPLGFSFLFLLIIFTKRYCSSTKKGIDNLNRIDYHDPQVLDPSLPSHSVVVNDTGISDRHDCVICLSIIHRGSDDDDDDEGDSSDKGSKVLPGCGHEFHVECIEVWLRACPVCPICRRRVSGDEGEGEGEEEGGVEEGLLFASYGLRMDYGLRFDELRESLLLF